ncbi:hypothetical protein C2S51_025294 [Perilla frutescens var. frutescens]|nr:hypothetical protein C2S51_025294 [Perilla frutescens var. frutescens]
MFFKYKVNNIDDHEPSYTVRSEDGEAEFWDDHNEEFQCGNISIHRHIINQRGLLLPVYHNAPVVVVYVIGEVNTHTHMQEMVLEDQYGCQEEKEERYRRP